MSSVTDVVLLGKDPGYRGSECGAVNETDGWRTGHKMTKDRNSLAQSKAENRLKESSPCKIEVGSAARARHFQVFARLKKHGDKKQDGRNGAKVEQ